MEAVTHPNAEQLTHWEKHFPLHESVPEAAAGCAHEPTGLPIWNAPFPPLALETRPAVNTAAAAYYLNRKQQTLRGWACLENGPIRPLRISGRLHWKTDDLRRLLGVAA